MRIKPIIVSILFTCQNQKHKPLESLIHHLLDSKFLYHFIDLLIRSISHPPQPSKTYPSTPSLQFLFSNILHVYKPGDDTRSSLLFLTLWVIFDPPKSQAVEARDIRLSHSLHMHFLVSASPTTCVSPWLTAFLLTSFQPSILMASVLSWWITEEPDCWSPWRLHVSDNS